MYVGTLKQNVQNVEGLKRTGARILDAVQQYITPRCADLHLELRVVTPYSFELLFCGCRLVIRVEIPWSESPRHGQLTAYRLTWDPQPNEKALKLLPPCCFDQGGFMITEGQPFREWCEDTSAGFLTSVFTALAAEAINLRP